MNEAIAPVLDAVRRDPGLALVVAGGLYLLLFVLTVWTLCRYGWMARRQARLLRGSDGSNLERMLLEQIDNASVVRGQIADAAERGNVNAAHIRLCLQKTGLVRYDAFPDVGGLQSFSLALLDAEDNGLVLSGLFSRHHMRVYAKPIERGASADSLTDEEKSAIAASCSAGVSAATRGSSR